MTLKICIYGTGAIGGLIAARLGRTNFDVSCIARGETLEAISDRGLRLISNGSDTNVHIRCTDDPHGLGPQDFVLLTLKAQNVPAIVRSIRPLIKDSTTIVSFQNGLPWWFFQNLPSPYGALRLESVDPGGGLTAAIDHHHVLGGVVYPAARIIEPGVVRHVSGERLAVGEPDGRLTPRLETLSAALEQGGFAALPVKTIRNEICLKWVSNAAINPISVLTGASMARMIETPAVYQTLSEVMQETAELCHRVGCPIPVPIADILTGAHKMGTHKSSMLQDFEQGRDLEWGPLLEAVQELSRLLKMRTPMFDKIMGLLRLKTGYR